jgi:effector-binding domain-containing protein
MTLHRFIGFALLTILMLSSIAMAYDSVYPRAELDNIEIHKLPPARVLEAKTEGTYFNNSNGLFSKLFNYIKDNEIAMTIPVEGGFQPSSMRFYLGNDAPRELEDTHKVSVVDLPERQVLRIGSKGAYSETNIMEALMKLESWLENQSQWLAHGAPYGVFWNGPITPWFLKRFEIHIPVKSKISQSSSTN